SPPKITGSTQLTNDGQIMHNMVTDGSRIYVLQQRPSGNVLAQVSVLGGETSVIPTTIKSIELAGISPDNSQLLITTGAPTGDLETPYWSLPLPAGSPRRVGDIVAVDLRWSADGQQIAFSKDSALHLAKGDGTGSRRLVSTESPPDNLVFAPDGKRI